MSPVMCCDSHHSTVSVGCPEVGFNKLFWRARRLAQPAFTVLAMLSDSECYLAEDFDAQLFMRIPTSVPVRALFDNSYTPEVLHSMKVALTSHDIDEACVDRCPSEFCRTPIFLESIYVVVLCNKCKSCYFCAFCLTVCRRLDAGDLACCNAAQSFSPVNKLTTNERLSSSTTERMRVRVETLLVSLQPDFRAEMVQRKRLSLQNYSLGDLVQKYGSINPVYVPQSVQSYDHVKRKRSDGADI